MYTSSSFYSPFHPSMEEQVELARQISHSLSADTNSTSRGQSMYVKRRNRSSKWIHAGNPKLYNLPTLLYANWYAHDSRAASAREIDSVLGKMAR